MFFPQFFFKFDNWKKYRLETIKEKSFQNIQSVYILVAFIYITVGRKEGSKEGKKEVREGGREGKGKLTNSLTFEIQFSTSMLELQRASKSSFHMH